MITEGSKAKYAFSLLLVLCYVMQSNADVDQKLMKTAMKCIGETKVNKNDLMKSIEKDSCTRTELTDAFFLCFFYKMETVDQSSYVVDQEKLIELVEKNKVDKYTGPGTQGCVRKAPKVPTDKVQASKDAGDIIQCSCKTHT